MEVLVERMRVIERNVFMSSQEFSGDLVGK